MPPVTRVRMISGAYATASGSPGPLERKIPSGSSASAASAVVLAGTSGSAATLAAEGVPVRYRRDRLTVHTDDGPSEAWVYIDHRVDPGRPRPGYLERIIDGAEHHGLPHRWIEFLRRWDPAHWPRRGGTSSSPAPQSLSELLADPVVLLRSPAEVLLSKFASPA